MTSPLSSRLEGTGSFNCEQETDVPQQPSNFMEKILTACLAKHSQLNDIQLNFFERRVVDILSQFTEEKLPAKEDFLQVRQKKLRDLQLIFSNIQTQCHVLQGQLDFCTTLKEKVPLEEDYTRNLSDTIVQASATLVSSEVQDLMNTPLENNKVEIKLLQEKVTAATTSLIAFYNAEITSSIKEFDSLNTKAEEIASRTGNFYNGLEKVLFLTQKVKLLKARIESLFPKTEKFQKMCTLICDLENIKQIEEKETHFMPFSKIREYEKDEKQSEVRLYLNKRMDMYGSIQDLLNRSLIT